MTDSSGKNNDLDEHPVLNNCNNVEHDNLTVARLLKQSSERDTSEKARDDGDELVPNIITPGLLSKCNEKPKGLHCTQEPVELTVEIMTSSDKCVKSKSSTEKQSEPKEDVVVSRNLNFTNEFAEMSVHSMSSFNKLKKSKSSMRRPTEP